jgi:transmembrane sensor
MLKIEEIEKIERYIKGLSDDVEKAFVESLFLNGEDNLFLKQSLEEDWNRLGHISHTEINLSHILDKVHHIIRKKETLYNMNPLQRLKQVYMRVAAILLLPLLIAGGLVYSYFGEHQTTKTDLLSSYTIFAPLGSRVSFNLPDGTKGMLNSGSHLSYSLPFTHNRKVQLDGEAWFDVVHDENHPFNIGTGNSTVRVLGTSFNVSAYPLDNYVEVVLQNGKVEFEDNINSVKVTMIPDDRLVFNNGNISKTVTDPSKYHAWSEGKLVFRGDSMTLVAHRIERWYNVKVILEDKELEKYSFRATFQDDSLEAVLHFLSMTSPIAYRISPRELLQDGTYKKEVVTIFMKQ